MTNPNTRCRGMPWWGWTILALAVVCNVATVAINNQRRSSEPQVVLAPDRMETPVAESLPPADPRVEVPARAEAPAAEPPIPAALPETADAAPLRSSEPAPSEVTVPIVPARDVPDLAPVGGLELPLSEPPAVRALPVEDTLADAPLGNAVPSPTPSLPSPERVRAALEQEILVKHVADKDRPAALVQVGQLQIRAKSLQLRDVAGPLDVTVDADSLSISREGLNLRCREFRLESGKHRISVSSAQGAVLIDPVPESQTPAPRS